jgi:hypothetical protein
MNERSRDRIRKPVSQFVYKMNRDRYEQTAKEYENRGKMFRRRAVKQHPKSDEFERRWG